MGLGHLAWPGTGGCRSLRQFAGSLHHRPYEACRELIQAARITEDGRRSLQQLMRGDRTPELMDRLMHLARALGSGDVNAGLERLLETAERQGREGGLLSPGPAPTR